MPIRTKSEIKYPNDLPLPNEKWRFDGAGRKLTTFATISLVYNDQKQLTGFRVDYKKIVGASFDLKGVLDGVDYPDRPNTKENSTYFNEVPGAKFK